MVERRNRIGAGKGSFSTFRGEQIEFRQGRRLPSELGLEVHGPLRPPLRAR